mgnify:CR=1 FL=1
MDINEPAISPEKILKLQDPAFGSGNVCIVTGCGTGISQETVVHDVMMCRSRVKEMMNPIDVGKLFIFLRPSSNR